MPLRPWLAQSRLLFVCLLALQLSACLGPPQPILKPANGRPFDYASDTFSFPNELLSRYQFDPGTGNMEIVGRNPDARYTLHCFVLARSARQFYQFAHFAPERPKVDDATYRRLVDVVVARSPREQEPEDRIIIPGYPDLHAFSLDKEALLKEELGGAIDSYIQRGNWRMIHSFSRDHQEQMARTLYAEVQDRRPPVVHITHRLSFTDFVLDHALVVYAATSGPEGIHFLVYDPNNPGRPEALDYDAAKRTFTFPANQYFAGGPVNIYEVYRSALY